MNSKIILDNIQREIFTSLKPLGFKKKGRTFNRITENGIVQVINFQTGQFPLGENYVVPGLRENLYGKFTVNLGVCVEDLFVLMFPYLPKNFYQDYECDFRQRLSILTKGNDYWWPLIVNDNEVCDEISKGINTEGLAWLDLFSTRNNIRLNWQKNGAPRAKFDFGVIMLKNERELGEKIIREYIKELGPSKTGHKSYVIDLARELGVNI